MKTKLTVLFIATILISYNLIAQDVKYVFELDCNEGIVQVYLNGKYGFINKERKEIVPVKYDEVSCFYDGIGGIKLNGKWGGVDKTGKEVIPIKYDENLIFSEGLAPVILNGKYGFIDKTDKLVIPAIYDNVNTFHDGKAKVQKNGEWISIDKPSVVSNNDNKYETVTIGTQTWMATNLEVKHYRNGDAIPEVKDNTAWQNTKAGGRCYYENSEMMGMFTGTLYNMYAIKDVRNICPEGWHIPTEEECQTLLNFLGGGVTDPSGFVDDNSEHEKAAALAIKSKALWDAIDTYKGTNSSGFSLFPTGLRGADGTFGRKGSTGYFWTADNESPNKTKVFFLNINSVIIMMTNDNMTTGYPIRCIKD